MSTNSTLFSEAAEVLVGGVNSPVRSFKAVGGTPIFFKSAKGAHLQDNDGKQYIDYIGSWGPMITGHCNDKIVSALQECCQHAISFGAPTTLETKLALKIRQHMPMMEKVRFVSSGTEATMTAIRLARGYTGRDKILKFAGHYHGHADALLVEAGSGALTLGIPSSPGIPKAYAEKTLVGEFNNLDSITKLFNEHGNQIAAVILEPITGNMNMVFPNDDFMQQLRTLCNEHGSLLIFDEVMTGFRVALNGATSLMPVKPDLITLGKVIGGGMPVGALGGHTQVMQHLAPEGPVYQAGTLSGNPMAMTAGLATISQIEQPGFFTALDEKRQLLTQGLIVLAQRHRIPFAMHGQGGMFGFVFADKTPKTFNDVKKANQKHFKLFFHAMLDAGIYLAPSPFEAGFISSAHTTDDINATLSAADKALSILH